MKTISKGTPARYAGHAVIVHHKQKPLTANTIIRVRGVESGKVMKVPFHLLEFPVPA